MLKKVFTYSLLGFLLFSGLPLAQAQGGDSFTAKGEVLSVVRTEQVFAAEKLSLLVEPSKELIEQDLEIKILSGRDKGEVVTVKNILEGGPFDLELKAGDKVFLQGNLLADDEVHYEIRDRWYLDGLIVIAVLVLILVLLLTGKKGLRALLGLLLSIAVIFLFFLPLLEKGYSPILLTLFTSLLITILSLLSILGKGKKSAVAFLGTLGGVILALVLAYLAGIIFLRLNGLGTEDSMILAANFTDYNFRGLLLAGFIIGALGACMDVAVSIVAGLEEVAMHATNVGSKELFRSGISIGRDIFGSMLNTLVFAYVGASLTLVILLSKSQVDLVALFNYGFVAEEIVRSLVGAIGLLATIPVTAFVGANLFKKR